MDKQVDTYSPSPSWPSEKLTIKNAIDGESIRIESVGLDNVDDVIFLVYFFASEMKELNDIKMRFKYWMETCFILRRNEILVLSS